MSNRRLKDSKTVPCSSFMSIEILSSTDPLGTDVGNELERLVMLLTRALILSMVVDIVVTEKKKVGAIG